MGYQSIIYGRIQGARDKQGDNLGLVHRHNRAVINAIPDTDDGWPFLTRHMFSVAERRNDDSPDRGLYKSQVIHFGASIKDFADKGVDWSVWLTKFENVLKHLLWHSVKLHIEKPFAPERVYVYRSDFETLKGMLDEVSELGKTTLKCHRWDRQVRDVDKIKTDWLL